MKSDFVVNGKGTHRWNSLDRSATCLLRTYKAQMIKIRPVHITNWDARRKSVTVQNLCVTEHLIKEKVKDKNQNSKREGP